ncbi:hypothetical protein FRC12_014807 [Ceratobasidium sp. 428]|nr:hypothetical protein FRC12_014807 [Ceratobasidium sp. 428]
MKMAQNNLYSGTQTLVIGNCVVHDLQILVLSVDAHSPFYQHDVCKVDCQDDCAAAWLFFLATVKHTACILTEQSNGVSFEPALLSIVSMDLPLPVVVLKHSLNGVIALLFVLGNGFDTLQSCSLDILKCIQMILQMFFFLKIWKSSLKTLGYSEKNHFITPNVYKILSNLVHSFLSLVIIYCKELDHPNYPLCPWLHSTKGTEHTFGEARKAHPNFDFSDLISVVPKLDVMAMSAVSKGDNFSDAKAHTSGYSLTLYSQLGIDIHAMSNLLGAKLIDQAAKVTHDEAEAIFARCGIEVTEQLCPPPHSSKATGSGTAAQRSTDNSDFTTSPIHEWYNEPKELNKVDFDTYDQNKSEMACNFAEEPRCLATKLNELLGNDLGNHH